MDGFGLHGWGMGIGWLLPLLLIAAVLYLMGGKKNEKLSAREILDRRYARGEIDTKEYRERLEELEASDREPD